jgi:hypothetical protein
VLPTNLLCPQDQRQQQTPTHQPLCAHCNRYLFLPNDALPLYGVRAWQHRDAIPAELLKMVSE